MKKNPSMMKMTLKMTVSTKQKILTKRILREIILKRNVPMKKTRTKIQKMNMTMLSIVLPAESVRSGILPRENRNMNPGKKVIHAPGKEVEFLLQPR